jgi:hypothetical protein
MYSSKNSNVMFEDGVLMAIALDVRACIGVVVASTVVFWNKQSLCCGCSSSGVVGVSSALMLWAVL